MEHQSPKIIQKNIVDIPKSSRGVFEVIQSNSSSIEHLTGGEIRIFQTNTSTIRDQTSKRRLETRQESRKEPDQPEVSDQNTSLKAGPTGEAKTEPIPVPVAEIFPVPIPGEIISGLNTAAGKIKAQIANQFFKTRLLQLISKAKEFLQSGKVPEAIAVLTVITDELDYIFDCSSTYGKRSVNLVRKSLIETERELVGIM